MKIYAIDRAYEGMQYDMFYSQYVHALEAMNEMVLEHHYNKDDFSIIEIEVK
jgi:hypothetical protein